MDRRRFIKASIAGIGMFSGALALGCVPGASAGSSTPQSPTESGGAVATASSLGIGGSSPADSQTAPLLSENRASATPTVKLNSGFVMPLLGIGTWTLSDSVAEESVYCALQNGYRDATIADIAAAHGASPAQVILRWHAQTGCIAIPGSSNPGHIAENIAIFDFELTCDEVTALAAINRQHRFERW